MGLIGAFFNGLGFSLGRKSAAPTGRHSRGNIGAYSRGRTRAKYGPGGRGVSTRVQLAGRPMRKPSITSGQASRLWWPR